MIALVLLVREKVASASRSILLLPIQKSVYITQELAIPNTLINKSKNPLLRTTLGKADSIEDGNTDGDVRAPMFVTVLNPVSFVYAGNRNLRVYQTGATRNKITSDSRKSLEHQMTCLHIETVKSTEMMQRCPFLPYGLAKCKSRGFQILE